MSANPYINAILASVYIALVVSGINTIGTLVGQGPDETILAPIAMLSLLVLSVAVMAFLFFYQPALLLLDGKRNEAVSFFLRTLGAFAGITVLVLAAVFAFLKY